MTDGMQEIDSAKDGKEGRKTKDEEDEDEDRRLTSRMRNPSAICGLEDLESWILFAGLWNMIPRVISEDLGDMSDARYTDFRYSNVQTLPDDQIYYETETQIVETKSFPNGIPNEC
ncbi:hypothetical protein FB451DRAFT_1193276 [Mycena latifolia]|nr:hypothetical protein FB451DRAFT_1193276 [Mycena latifolia]